ncbi:hypothetical protein BDW22DRAFT_957537 [Trametopsis cervina]|nr:hypothetical protein BDW22DRAFT_957537 [Trametopsis cervina]
MFSLTSSVVAVSLAALAAAQVTITVGGPPSKPFQFSPPNVTASNGTVVTFVYAGSPGFHSVTQSSFASPCDPEPSGFDSGFVFIPPNNTNPVPSWNLTITDDSTPIWFYCGQLAPIPHCTQGMVGSINAPTSGNRTFAAFQQAAIALNNTHTPGAPIPNLNGVGANATAVPGPLSGGMTASAAPSGPTPNAPGVTVSANTSGAPSPSSAAAGSGSSAPSAPSPTSAASGAVVNSANVITVLSAALFAAAVL